MKWYFFALCISFSFVSIPVTFGHESKESNGTIIFFHADPDHVPVAREPSGFRVLVTKRDGKFPVADCDCRLKLFEGGKEILSASLFENGKSSTILPYEFSHSGLFSARVTGTPKPEKETSFTPFTLTFDVSVEGEKGIKGLLRGYSWLVAVSGLLFVIAIVTCVRVYLRNK